MENSSQQGNLSGDSRLNSSHAYLSRAAGAVQAGDKMLGIHLYLAAFERALHENLVPSEEALAGMEKAWKLALELKQRSIAEYIYEKLEPFWNADDTLSHAAELQTLALSKLEEFGFDPEIIKDMAEMVNLDLEQMASGFMFSMDSSNVHPTYMGGLELPAISLQFGDDSAHESSESSEEGILEVEATEVVIPFTGPNPLKEPYLTAQERQLAKGEEMHDEAIEQTKIVPTRGGKPAPDALEQQRFNYSATMGFESAIAAMADFGVGCSSPEFDSFIEMLNKRHGLSHMPGLGTIVFRGQAREDANYFLVATAGELAVPAVRMRLDENAQGQLVLSVLASPDFRIPLNRVAQTGFEGPATLILEDLDLWNLPPLDIDPFDFHSLAQIQLSRGAREALALITSALEEPHVNVLISAKRPENIQPFFQQLVGSYRTVDIALPNKEERTQLWRNAFAMHPSLRGLDLERMVAFSRSLSRFEIYLVTTEAIEDAYRESIRQRNFVAVEFDDMLQRLASFQPLDSWEYRKMEELLVDSFKQDLDSLDDLLKG